MYSNLARSLSAACALFSAWLLLPAAYAAEPHLKWSFDTKGKIYTSPILADLDGDGRTEIIVCASRGKSVLCLDGAGNLLWDYQIEGKNRDGIQATPSCVDFDGDGKKEVFFVDTNGVAGCLNYQGRLLWRTFTGDRVDYNGCVVADINNDGRIEVVFGSDSGTVYCLDDCGMVLWRFQGDGEVRGIPALAFHEPTSTLRVYAVFSGGAAACLDSDGNLVWSVNEPGPLKQRRSGPAVGDLDGDGQAEVITATEEFNVIVSDAETGAEKWRWKSGSTLDQTGSFALADFDGSGRLDIVCGDFSGRVYRLRDGKALWTANVGGGVVQGPSIADVTGDGELEILVCSRGNRMTILSSRGQEKWAYPTETGSLTTPAVGDVDGDGKTEIVFTSKDYKIYCVTVGGAFRPDRMPWPMISHDAQLSGNWKGPFTTAVTPAQSAALNVPLSIKRFAPLRLGENVVELTYENQAPRSRHLEVVAEIARPGAGALTKTQSLRCEPYQSQVVRIDLAAQYEGRYVLSARLVDVGTGKTLATAGDSSELKPFEAERQELESLRTAGAVLAASLKSVDTKARAEDALQRAVAAVTAALPASLGAPRLGAPRLGAPRLGAPASLPAHEQEAEAGKDAGAPSGSQAARTARAALHDLNKVVARLRAAAVTPGGAADFAVVPETTLRKVFKDEPCLEDDRLPRACALSVAGNELEGIQIVVVPLWKDLANLRVSVSDLTQSGGNGRIPAQDVSVNRVGYVQIGPPEYNFVVEKLGEWPDIMFPDTPANVPASQDAQPYFITVKAQETTPAGDYTGTIRVETDGAAPIEMPLSVHVWGFHLSKETHLKTSFWISENMIKSFYKYEDRTPFEVRKRYYQYHLDRRAGPVMAFPLNGGDMLEDFEYLLANGQNCFFIHTPDVHGAGRDEYARKALATRDLLTQKGWNDLALFYSLDEVAVMARPLIPKMVETNAWFKKLIPDWPRLQTSAPEPSLFGAVDVWCPTIDSFNPKMLADRKAQGDRNWFYTVWGRPGIMIEFPATDARLMFWQCWKYGAEGFLYWGTTHWSLNVTSGKRWPEIPWITYNQQPGHNGCGYLIYPGPDGTPLGSIRFEAIRDGIEDYEYLYLLRELLSTAGNALPSELKGRAETELAIAPEVLISNTQFTEDPDVILAARTRVAELIEAIQKHAKP